MNDYDRKLQMPTRSKSSKWLLSVVLFLAIGCSHVEPIMLSSEEINKALAGNTIVHENRRNGFKWFFSQDGNQVFDPDSGFPISGHWYISAETQQLCWWEVDPNLPGCASIKLHGDQILFDYGDEVISHKLVKGNNTDLKNNPGRYFDPSRELAIRDLQDVFIEPPSVLLLPALAKLSGTWYGIWKTFRDFAIVIEKIDEQNAELIYAWGPDKFSNDGTAGWSGAIGYVEGNSLRFNRGSGGIVNLTLRVDGTLEVIYKSKVAAFHSIATRWKDPPWEPFVSQVSTLTPAQRRMKIERDIAEIYSDYSSEIQQFFAEEAFNAGVKEIRALKPSEKRTPVHKNEGVGCAYGMWRRKLILIEINQPRCVLLSVLAHEISHIGSKCNGHNDHFYKYNSLVAKRYEEQLPNAVKRKWFAPVQDVASVAAIYWSKEC